MSPEHKSLPQPDVSIVLVGLNAKKFVSECIASILKAVWRSVTYEIIYVDNGSMDGSVEYIKNIFPDSVRIIANKTNLGFCRAANQGAGISTGRHLYFINDDTLVIDDAIARTVEYMDSHPDVGTIGSRLIFPDGKEQYSGRMFPGIASAIFGRRSWLTKAFPNIKPVSDYLCKKQLEKNIPFEVDWVSAAGQLVRRSDFYSVNGYAEDYYYWHEAVFCHRLTKKKRRIILDPQSVIIHYEGQGSGPRPIQVQRFHINNFHQGAFRAYCERYNVKKTNPVYYLLFGALSIRQGLLLLSTQSRFFFLQSYRLRPAMTFSRNRKPNKMAVEKWLSQIPQYTRNARHLRALLQHGTPAKYVNFIRAEYERILRKNQVSSRPYIAFIDPTNYCNLRCPLCPTGVKQLGRKQSKMDFKAFKAYLDPLIPYLFEVNLHNWGEPLLNDNLFDMIRYARENNIGTNMSSNFVVAREKTIEALIDSGLEYLIISLDGTCQESYSAYRVRGDFNQVIDNMKLLIKKRDEKKQKIPFVEWQFIVMKHNEHEIEEARRLSEKIGVDLLRFIHVGIPYDFPEKNKLRKKWYPVTFQKKSNNVVARPPAVKPSPCFYLYRSIIINSDGGVSPCCEVYQKKHDFGKIDNNGGFNIDEFWNNRNYISARSLFNRRLPAPKQQTVCDSCKIFLKHPAKRMKKGKALK